MTITQKLAALRARMKEKNIDAWLVPTDDFHGSEYVGEHFKCRKYITGFTGSAGTAVIMQDMAGLWTDGRYFIQAAAQLKDSTITLFKTGEPGVPSVHEFLKEKLEKGTCLGFDGRTVNACEAWQMRKMLEKKGVSLSVGLDLVGDIWEDRPPLSCNPVWELGEQWAGESRRDKCARIRKAVKENGADVFILTALDDIAWLLNLRGSDIPCCPVFLSYLIMTETEILLFANESAFSAELIQKLTADGIVLQPYDSVYKYVNNFRYGTEVLLSRRKVNCRLVSSLPPDVVILDRNNPTLLPKAVKNPTEVQHERDAHIRDGVALTKFIYWLKKNVGRTPITELSAEKKLYELRSQQKNFLGNSFDPIVSYGIHAAIVHYSATPETDISIEPKGLLLVDSGGHYLEGTTDVTRTIAMGPLTDDEKKMFTVVLRGMLNLADIKFLHGCTGQNLDILARFPLWEIGMDFKHGTGHGVGYLLNVHEGPNSFRLKNGSGTENAALEEGMITSDEPGYYKENAFGIRHENLLVCKRAEKTSFGQFLRFEHLTMAPIDLEGVIPGLMTEKERALLNQYHARVYEKISPYLDTDERAWLKSSTKAI